MPEKKPVYNVYCDESCHLLNDHNKTFVLGAIWVEKNKVSQIFQDLRRIKAEHGLSPNFEAKWTKISKAKVDYYCEVIHYFFENPDLHFRGVVVPDKSILNHAAYSQDHNTWYYKMFYLLLSVVIRGRADYNLYLDMKDTKSHLKVLELKRILNIASVEDVSVQKAQQIRSNEVEVMQLVDILIGALSYKNRSLSQNEGKVMVIDTIENSIGERMMASSPLAEQKFNVLIWKPRK